MEKRTAGVGEGIRDQTQDRRSYADVRSSTAAEQGGKRDRGGEKKSPERPRGSRGLGREDVRDPGNTLLYEALTLDATPKGASDGWKEEEPGIGVDLETRGSQRGGGKRGHREKGGGKLSLLWGRADKGDVGKISKLNAKKEVDWGEKGKREAWGQKRKIPINFSLMAD